MAKIRPRGADGNPLSWTHIFSRDDGSRIEARLSRSGVSDLNKDKGKIVRVIGEKNYEKIKKARYDWLFDDLQQFTSISADSIETKDDLRAFVEDTVGKSKGFLKMKERAPRRYESSITRMMAGLWYKGEVLSVAKTNVVEEVKEDRASLIVERIKNDRSRRKALSDARLGNLYRVRKDKIVAKRVDKRGRRFHIDLLTGRRTRDPLKILRELGFK